MQIISNGILKFYCLGEGFAQDTCTYKMSLKKYYPKIAGRLAQLVERRTREHNVSGLYRFESTAGQLKLLIVFQMRR